MLWIVSGGLAVACLVFGAVCMVRYGKAKSGRVPVQATVAEIKVSDERDKKGKKQFVAVLQYTAGGREITAEAQRPVATGEYRTGQKVKGYCDKGDAQRFYFEEDMYSLVVPVLMLAVGLAMAAWTVWLLLRLA